MFIACSERNNSLEVLPVGFISAGARNNN